MDMKLIKIQIQLNPTPHHFILDIVPFVNVTSVQHLKNFTKNNFFKTIKI